MGACHCICRDCLARIRPNWRASWLPLPHASALEGEGASLPSAINPALCDRRSARLLRVARAGEAKADHNFDPVAHRVTFLPLPLHANNRPFPHL